MRINPFYLHGENITPVRKLLMLKAFAKGIPINEYTATGNPLTFETNLTENLLQMLCPFSPVQASGTPSPTNVLPITGFNGVTVYHSGQDTSNPTTYNVAFPAMGRNLANIADQTFTQVVNVALSYPLPVGTYTITASCVSNDTDGTTCRVAFMKSGGTEAIATLQFERNTEVSKTVTISEDCYSISFYAGTNYSKSAGDTATFSNISIKSHTSYGGMIDLTTGTITVTHAGLTFGKPDYATSINTISEISGGYTRFWVGVSYSAKRKKGNVPICNMALANSSVGYAHYSDAGNYLGAADEYQQSFWCILPTSLVGATSNSIKTALESNNFQFAYELETPQTYQLTPQQIATLKGQNVVWSNTNGTNTVKYLKKG